MSDDEGGFFGLVDAIWAGADRKRNTLKRKHGAALGNWLADINQYGCAWMGNAWEWTAVSAENHPAFMGYFGPSILAWDWGTHSGGWGGWKKPHKEHRGWQQVLMAQIGEKNEDGWTTYVSVQP